MHAYDFLTSGGLDLKLLLSDSQMREELIKKISHQNYGKDVVFWHQSQEEEKVDELVKKLTEHTNLPIVSSLEEVKNRTAQKVVIVKKIFKVGENLSKQISDVRALGLEVEVLCLCAHSRARVEGYAYENDVVVKSLYYLDDQRY